MYAFHYRCPAPRGARGRAPPRRPATLLSAPATTRDSRVGVATVDCTGAETTETPDSSGQLRSASLGMLRSVTSHLASTFDRPPVAPLATSGAAQQASARVIRCQDCTGNVWQLAVDRKGTGSLTVVPSSAGLSASAAAVSFPLPTDAALESQLFGLCEDVTSAVWLTDGAGLWRLDPRRSQGRSLSDVAWVRFDIPTAVPMRELEEGVLVTNLHQWDSGHAVCGIQPATRIPAGKTDAEAYAHHALSVSSDGEPVAQSIDGVDFPNTWRQGPRLPFGNHDIHSAVCSDVLYVSGGLAHAGFPCEYRVFDEVFALRPGAAAWEVVARMPERRTYNGLAALGGELWFCGGADGPEGHTGSHTEGGPAKRSVPETPKIGVAFAWTLLV